MTLAERLWAAVDEPATLRGEARALADLALARDLLDGIDSREDLDTLDWLSGLDSSLWLERLLARLEEIGRAKEAVELAARVLPIADGPVVLESAALVLTRAGRSAEAGALLRSAVEGQEMGTEVLLDLGRTFEGQFASGDIEAIYRRAS